MERDVDGKFFGTIFGRRKRVSRPPKELVSDLKSITPAKDITEFEYPPESSFYQDITDECHKD